MSTVLSFRPAMNDTPEMREANTQLVGDFYEAFAAGDLGSAMRFVASDFIIHVPGRGPTAGEYCGPEGIREFMNNVTPRTQLRRQLLRMPCSKYKLDLVALATGVGDVWVVEYLRLNRRWDATVQTTIALMHFEIEDEEIVRMDDLPLDNPAWERFHSAAAPTVAASGAGRT